MPAERSGFCIFEFVYFARPDSRLGGVGVHAARVRMGERLAEESPADADLVMSIPDSGTPAAIGFAKRSGIPYQEGLIKNRYVGRTFIEPDQELRQQGIRLKFNPLEEIAGKRIVVVDDSIVRGTTMRQLVQMLFDAGAAAVHVRISSPPVVSPCYYGIDMADEAELAAAHRSVKQMRDTIGATTLQYLSVAGMQWATRQADGNVCRACFTRDYPTRIPAERNLAKLRFEPAGVL
jgi:amidophosphoribosyltransferase